MRSAVFMVDILVLLYGSGVLYIGNDMGFLDQIVPQRL